MTSVLRRLSDASATSLTCSGRLFWAVQRVFRAGPPLGSGLQPNLVAITTWSRTGVQRFAHEFFVCEGTIAFGGVEKCDATFDSRPDQRDHFLLVACRTVANAHSHTAEPESRDFQVAISKFARFHVSSP